ncbi:Rieske 2Fe-2S domain-containing protein [Streptomyces roseolilacinus]|uniref:Rieske 2Fe-2S domain-containing protein n=1 Tax=Streptomyces roseolilacinus TaxID=66904 RepID=UPI003825EBE5
MDQIEYNLLRHTWFPLARLDDLKDGVASGHILGEELVVYGDGGNVTVAQGHCPHRGVALRLGRTRGDTLECPYHGWLFAGGTGRCVRIPSLPDGTGKPNASLRTFPTRIAYGLVWSCLEEPFLPFPRLPRYIDDSWRIAPGSPYSLRCGMRQLTENFRDKAHFPFVHAGTMGDVETTVAPYRVLQDGWELSWSSSWRSANTPSRFATEPGHRLDYHVTLPMFASIRVTSPSGGQRLVAQLATPVTSDGQRVRQFWLAGVDGVSIDQGADLADILDYERQVFEEDHPIVENQLPAEAPLDLHSQVHTGADKFSIAYRRRYAELLEEYKTRA